MISDRLVNVSERWFRLLERLYPPDFRDDIGDAVVETYRDRARDALRRGGILRLALVWMRALADSLRNGPGERVRPAVSVLPERQSDRHEDSTARHPALPEL